MSEKIIPLINLDPTNDPVYFVATDPFDEHGQATVIENTASRSGLDAMCQLIKLLNQNPAQQEKLPLFDTINAELQFPMDVTEMTNQVLETATDANAIKTALLVNEQSQPGFIHAVKGALLTPDNSYNLNGYVIVSIPGAVLDAKYQRPPLLEG